MTAAVQMNTRLDKVTKIAGDAVFARYGYTPSAAVQSLWAYVVQHDELPAFMPSRTPKKSKEEAVAEIRDNAGMAVRMFSDMLGIPLDQGRLEELSYDELRELSWEERGYLRG